MWVADALLGESACEPARGAARPSFGNATLVLSTRGSELLAASVDVRGAFAELVAEFRVFVATGREDESRCGERQWPAGESQP